MADGHVQVALDGAGKKIDNAELVRDPTTQGEDGATVYRQRTALGSDENPRLLVDVTGEPGRGALSVEAKNLDDIWEKLDEISTLLKMAIG